MVELLMVEAWMGVINNAAGSGSADCDIQCRVAILMDLMGF